MGTGGKMLVDLAHIRREKDCRLYVRRYGRSIRLRQTPGTQAFLDEYQLALQKLDAAAPAPKPVLTPPAKDSFRWLCTHYYRSAEFKLLAPSTQKARRRIIDAVCIKHGAKPFVLMQPAHVRQLRETPRPNCRRPPTPCSRRCAGSLHGRWRSGTSSLAQPSRCQS